MRLTRIKRFKNHRMLMIVVLTIFVFFLTVGYATFTTRLTLRTKGNVYPGINVDELISKAVTSGDGLYADSYENGAYVFRGGNPDNYLTLNNEVWRIMSIDPSGNLKIIRDEPLNYMPFDLSDSSSLIAGSRSSSNDSDYCYANRSDLGCNVWGSSSTMRNSAGVLLSDTSDGAVMPMYLPSSLTYYLPSDEAYLSVYLNGGTYDGATLNSWFDTWSSGMEANVKSKILSNHLWNVGFVARAWDGIGSLSSQILQEKDYTWQGRVGLMLMSDYAKATNSPSCAYNSSYFMDSGCTANSSQYNYLYKGNEILQVFMTPSSSFESHYVWSVEEDGNSIYLRDCDADEDFDVRPVLYLSSDVRFAGNGTSSNKYTIVS